MFSTHHYSGTGVNTLVHVTQIENGILDFIPLFIFTAVSRSTAY